MSFHSIVVKYSEKYIQLYHPQYVIMATDFGKNVQPILRLFQDPTKIEQITEKDTERPQYLTAYVVT